jgi:uncharacterized oligopeptide transporter (OPT) family protein
MAPVLNLLLKAYGIGTPTPAPERAASRRRPRLMASVAKGMFGGDLPWGLIGIGTMIGVAIIVVDEWLKRRNAPYRAPVLARGRRHLPAARTVGADLRRWHDLALRRAPAGVHGENPEAERAKRNGSCSRPGSSRAKR